ncbi:MAG TPA: putative toxin-antitoxin system toxin component, PIN family [Stellaceae bacterium]
MVSAALKVDSVPSRAVHAVLQHGILLKFDATERQLFDVLACRDPTDDKFLELAINGRADVIVSGDADLLVLHPFRGIPIVLPPVFLRDIARSASPP